MGEKRKELEAYALGEVRVKQKVKDVYVSCERTKMFMKMESAKGGKGTQLKAVERVDLEVGAILNNQVSTTQTQ